jgi:DHA2 family multidrug resistance protein
MYMIASGIIMFVAFSWLMSQMSLDSSASSISETLILRGLGLAIITVPLTTLAISGLDTKDIPQGAALNNMMRQLGGSFGLAFVNTYLHVQNAQHRTDLIAHIRPDNTLSMERLSNYTQYFMAHGYAKLHAQAQSLKLMDNIVIKQASQLSFRDAYLMIGLVFTIALPLLLFAAKRKGKVQVILSDH